MFENVEIKIKNEKAVFSATSVIGNSKMCSIPLEMLEGIDWAKETKEELVKVLIKKDYGEVAVKIASKKVK